MLLKKEKESHGRELLKKKNIGKEFILWSQFGSNIPLMHEPQKSNCMPCIYFSMKFSPEELLFVITINKNRQLLYAVKVDNLGLHAHFPKSS